MPADTRFGRIFVKYSWNLPLFDFPSQQIKIVERARSGASALKMDDRVEHYDVRQGISDYNFITRPNSIYHISVGTIPLDICQHVPIKWSKKVVGCRTGTSGENYIASFSSNELRIKRYPRNGLPSSLLFSVQSVLWYVYFCLCFHRYQHHPE